MTPRSRFRPTPICLALVSTGLLVAAGMGALRSQPAAPAPAKLGSPLQVADDLDGIVQPRFQEDAGEFGVSRLMPAVSGHRVGFMGYFDAKTPGERTLLNRAGSARRDYVIAFLHCAHVPGQKAGDTRSEAHHGPLNGAGDRYLTTLVVTKDLAPDAPSTSLSRSTFGIRNSGYPVGYEKLEGRLQQAAITNIPGPLHGRAVQTGVDGWTVFLRPVRASADSCVGCHVGSKRGDTLGVMLYAVGSKVNKG